MTPVVRAAIGSRVKRPARNGIAPAISKREGQVEVEFNGTLSRPRPSMPAVPAGPIAITHEGGVVTLANLFVRERPQSR